MLSLPIAITIKSKLLLNRCLHLHTSILLGTARAETQPSITSPPSILPRQSQCFYGCEQIFPVLSNIYEKWLCWLRAFKPLHIWLAAVSHFSKRGNWIQTTSSAQDSWRMAAAGCGISRPMTQQQSAASLSRARAGSSRDSIFQIFQ